MTQEKKKVNKKNLNENLMKKISLTLLITLLLISAINILQVSLLKSDFNALLEKSIEEQKPAQVSLTIIDPQCAQCFDINDYVEKVSNSKKTNITSTITLDLNSNQAKELIEMYGIDKFPALIVQGNIEKSSTLLNTLNSIGEKFDDTTYYLTPVNPLYVNQKGDIVGKVEAFALDKFDCEDCEKSQTYIDEIKRVGVEFSSIKTYDVDSAQGQELIKKYNLDKVPNIVFSSELGMYPQFENGWEQAGSIEEDGSYVLRNLRLPYYSISDDRMVGALDFTYVYDSSCKNCFDVQKTFDAVFAQFGISASKKNIVDISKNTSLVEKYNLNKVPALIINGDTNYYPIFDNWEEVGTLESDSSYIFRNVDLLDLEYKNLN